jgi:hypothetical protein
MHIHSVLETTIVSNKNLRQPFHYLSLRKEFIHDLLDLDLREA